MKSKLAAALLAIFLGSLGIHQFYLGNTTKGIFYLLFCWTFIPSVIGFIDGIMYLLMTPEEFNFRFNPSYSQNAADPLFTNSFNGTSNNDPSGELAKLHDLLQKGAISQAEYEAAKAKILNR